MIKPRSGCRDLSRRAFERTSGLSWNEVGSQRSSGHRRHHEQEVNRLCREAVARREGTHRRQAAVGAKSRRYVRQRH